VAEVAGGRRQARERALALLYEADAKGSTPTAVVEELPLPPDSFAVELVHGVEARKVEIDEMIAKHSIGWSVDRMPVIDRTVLRLATYELIGRPDVPTGVVISEAVELAKQYSTDESGRFVNGVLSAVAGAARPGEAPVSAPGDA
jgi:transcription antitermination protein NusB